MICDVCGRENAEKLTFCQDCGRRLQNQAPRVVAATPPTGLPKFELPLSAAERANSAKDAQQPPGRSRPEAPAFAFGPSDVPPIPPPAPSVPPPKTGGPPRPVATTPPPVPRPIAAPVSTRPAREGGGPIDCVSCATTNPPNYRFCVSCGAALQANRSATPAPKIPIAPRAQPAAPAIAPSVADEKIVPTAVVEIAPSRSAPIKLVSCTRCRGQCAPGTRFCKFCGAALEEPAGRDDAGRAEPAPAPQSVAAFINGGGVAARDSAPPPLRSERPPAPLPPPVPRTNSTEPGRQDPARLGQNVVRELGRMIIISEDGSEGRSFPITTPQTDVGRLEGEVLLKDDAYVSPRHARLVETKDGLVLRDLASTNGVFVRIRTRVPLRDGDLLLLGLEVLQFHAVSNAERGLGHASQHGTLLFGSPAVPRHARLCQRTIEGITRDVYHLFRDETVIGREQGDIVFSSDPFLSRRHASITRDPVTSEFSVADLESSNGSYRAIRDDYRIVNGDFVRIGQHLFRVDLR